MNLRSFLKYMVVGVVAVGGALVGVSTFAAGRANEQYIPLFTFKTGPAAPLGIPINAGYVDYFTMLNRRDGGVGGVKLTWEECETGRDTAKGIECYEKMKNRGPTGASLINPISTDTATALFERSAIDKIPLFLGGYGQSETSDGRVFPWVFPIGTNYWSMNTAMVRYIGMRLGGMSHLRGKTIVNLHHASGFGRETKQILDIQAKKYGFRVVHIEVPNPGKDQVDQWKQIMEIKPDWVILRGIGVMNPVALITAHKFGYPVSRILGITWAGSEVDVVPAGRAARGYIAAALSLPGKNFPIVQDILRYVYSNGRHGELPDATGVGSTYYNRALSGAILMVEAIRTAQGRYGKRPLTGEEVRWGFENLNLSDRRIAELGAFGVSQPLRLSCADHEGGGTVRFQRWNGREWRPVTGWIEGDQSIVRPLIEKTAMEYARQKGITPRHCPKELNTARLQY